MHRTKLEGVNMMKKKRILPVIMLITSISFCISLSIIICSMSSSFATARPSSTTYHITDLPVTIEENVYNPANYYQYGTTVGMFSWNNKLYAHCKTSFNEQLKRKFFVFQDNDITILLEDCSIYGFENGYVYYSKSKSVSLIDKVMCMDIRSEGHTELMTTEGILSDTVVDEKGICYIPTDIRLSEYYAVKDGEIIECKNMTWAHSAGTNTYAVEDKDLICYRPSGFREVILDSIGIGKICIIPHELGLLIYNDDATDLLYFIPNETGEIEELFRVEGLSTDSAANVYGEFVYVSFVRYAGFDDIGLTKYENDTMEGTYRISLVDYSVEKLTERTYDGFYIFDDTGIFACKDGCIYKLDFDCNVIMALME